MRLNSIIVIVWFAGTLIFGSVHAQKYNIYQGDTINRVNEQGIKQGKWINFDATGKTIIEKGAYYNNKKDGLWTSYFPSGKVKHEITFKSGIANGPARFYYNTGQLWEEGTWVIDHWTGPYRFYYPSGQVAYDWNYNAMGKRTGEQKYFHENGNLKYVGKWENGKTTGSLKIYTEDGKLSAERVYEEGKFEKTIDHLSGQVAVDQGVKNVSVQFTGTGYHTIYNMSGKIEKKGYFENGRLISGEQMIYNGDGKLSSKLIFDKGVLKDTIYYDNK